MAKKKTGLSQAAVARKSNAAKPPAEKSGRPRDDQRPALTPIGRNMQSIASALEAASALIKAAGGVDRATKLVDEVQELIGACGTAEDAKAMLNACGKLLECKTSAPTETSTSASDEEDDSEGLAD